MTIKTWRNDFLKICKGCKQFIDKGGGRYRYQCGKYVCSIYKAFKCTKLNNVMQKASAISKAALDEAFFNLTGSHMGEGK